MTPDFGVRINSMIKALGEIVLPVVPGEHAIAVEQLEITIGQLEMLSLQWPYLHKFHARCLHDIGLLAAEIADAVPAYADRLRQAVSEAEAARHGADLAELATARDRVARAVCAVIEDVAARDGDDVWRTLNAIVVRHERAEHDRDRIWFARTGMDPEAADLPPIASLFA